MPNCSLHGCQLLQPTASLELQDLVGALLKRLAALQVSQAIVLTHFVIAGTNHIDCIDQNRAHTQHPRHDKRLRRLVLGMHEVRRGLLCRKIRLLIVATDLEGYPPVEEKYAELVSVAGEQEVPTVAPMNRSALGLLFHSLC